MGYNECRSKGLSMKRLVTSTVLILLAAITMGAGSIAVNGVIYLSLDASAAPSGLGQWKERRIIPFSSKDQGKSWHYTGTLTNYDDANSLGYFALTASSLVRQGNNLYMLVTPTGAKGLGKKNRAHNGTLVILIADITKAKLERDGRGELVVKKHI